MRVIHLFRHGQVNGPAALYGHTDIALSDAGREVLARATDGLAQPDLVVTSPLRRCHGFAAAQAHEVGCQLEVEDNFREMNFGEWDGVPYSEDSPFWSSMEQFWREPSIVTPPGGESLYQMHCRVSTAWHRLLAGQHGVTWVFAHGGVIRLILAQLLDLDWRNQALYSVLQIGYASRTDIICHQYDQSTIVQVKAIAIPAPV